MKFVLSTAFSPAEHLIPLAREADACGYEAMTFSDHIVHPEVLDTPYPYTEDGSRRWEAFTPWVDAWVTIGACAAVTSRLRFTNNVFVLAMRNPFVAAKAISTAAVLSGGRVTLTVGVGWSNIEFELMGQNFRDRGKRTDEMLTILPKLWSGEMVNHEGQYYRFDNLEMNPVPPERIPIWVGGISDAALRRAARHDGWLSDLQTSEEIIESIARTRSYREELGRGDLPFDVMASPSDAASVEDFRRLGDAGVTHMLSIPWIPYHGLTDDLEKKLDGLRRYAKDVMAAMG